MTCSPLLHFFVDLTLKTRSSASMATKISSQPRDYDQQNLSDVAPRAFVNKKNTKCDKNLSNNS